MIRRYRSTFAVSTHNSRSHVTELFGHHFLFQPFIQSSKVNRHVAKTLGADGTRVIDLDILLITVDVHAMTAIEEHDRRRRCKHEVAADGTVRFKRTLNTLVLTKAGMHTSIAPHAVEIVNIKTFANTADFAVRAMIDIFVLIIVKEIASLAKVTRLFAATLWVDTLLGSWLYNGARHAHHLLDQPTINEVILCFVVAETTCVQLSTARCLNFAAAFVVLTTENLGVGVMVRR